MSQVLLAALILGGIFRTPPVHLEEFNASIGGQLVDYTHNHGQDRRIHSQILCEKRDLYVYLPPCYDPSRQYPLIIWMHGAFGDETPFPIAGAVKYLDQKILAGCFPPVIVVSADATMKGNNTLLSRNSMFINGDSGCFEDHLMKEIIPFILSSYSIRPERDARALCGYSGGGLPAMGLGIKYREMFGIVTAISGPLNLRYSNRQNRYFANFDPCEYQWATKYRPCQKVTMYFGGLLHVPAKFFIMPIFGRGQDVIHRVRQSNPADLLFSQNLQPGELKIYIRYAERDNFNFDAQTESFIWLARKRGIEITAKEDKGQRHTSEYCTFGQKRAYDWLAGQIMGPTEPAEIEEGVSPVPAEPEPEEAKSSVPPPKVLSPVAELPLSSQATNVPSPRVLRPKHEEKIDQTAEESVSPVPEEFLRLPKKQEPTQEGPASSAEPPVSGWRKAQKSRTVLASNARSYSLPPLD